MKQSRRNAAAEQAKASRTKPAQSKYASKGKAYDYSDVYRDKPEPNRRDRGSHIRK